MACLNPISRQVWDYRQNKMVLVQVPCGHCLNCREAFRKSWSFRIKKTACSSDGFIYDTLTLRPSAMPTLDYHEIVEDGALHIPKEYLDFPREVEPHDEIISINDKCLWLLEFYKFKLPYLPRTVVSDWLKKGRDRYNMLHHKAIESGKMERLKLRYAAVLEYGPKYSRPHVHIMLFGISYSDYVRCFAKQWRGLYGFTKTKWVKPGDRKSAGNVAGYLSKYFVKGDYVSPLVESKLLPKEWRLLSHGLGVEYVKNPRLDNIYRYLNMDRKIWKLCVDTSIDSEDKDLIERLSLLMYESLDCLPAGDERKVLDALTVAYDGKYPLALPRYYKNKLLNADKKSVAYVTLSSYLLACNSQRKFAQVCAYFSAKTGRSPAEAQIILYANDLLYHHWFDEFSAFEKEQILAKAKRVQIKEHNHFIRNYNRISYSVNTINEDFDD